MADPQWLIELYEITVLDSPRQRASDFTQWKRRWLVHLDCADVVPSEHLPTVIDSVEENIRGALGRQLGQLMVHIATERDYLLSSGMDRLVKFCGTVTAVRYQPDQEAPGDETGKGLPRTTLVSRNHRSMMVKFRGGDGWLEWIGRAQALLNVSIAGEEYPRIRYGEEGADWGADRGPCHDCSVVVGELHVPGCDGERCPKCGGHAISCACGGSVGGWTEND